MADDYWVKTKRKSLSSLDVRTNNNIVESRRETRDWSELDFDVLQQILSCLSFMDILQAKAVCRHWRSVTKSIIQSCVPLQRVVPLLLIPPQEEEEEEEEGKKATSCCFLVSPEGRRVYNSKENMPKEICTGCCIGSSHGWMIFLDEKIAPYLLNPLTGARIEFPRIDSFLGIERIARDINGDGSGEFLVDYVTDWGRCSTSTKLLQRLIPKAILASNSKQDNFAMVLICSENKKLAFCNHKDNFWTDLSCQQGPYVDIMSHENQLYALDKYGSVVEVWEIGNGPRPAKKMTIELPSPRRSLQVSQYYGDLCNYTLYLAESHGDILLVFRFIGELVDGYGRLLREEDLLTDESRHPLVCPYKTILFHLYELDIKNKQWLGVESLHDRVLFLGGNHSMSISARDLAATKGNSIYFIDDYWMRMEEDYLYGGHDMGVFYLEDESVEPFYETVAMRIQPPPCWIIPHPF